MTDRGSAFWSLAKITISLIASVVIQGILAYRFRVFAYVDLPLILNIYYGFTLGRPIASVVIGTTVGLMQDSLSGLPLGTNGWRNYATEFTTGSATHAVRVIVRRQDCPVAGPCPAFGKLWLDDFVLTDNS